MEHGQTTLAVSGGRIKMALFFIAPLILLGLAHAARPHLVEPWCTINPSDCAPEALNWLDRWFFDLRIQDSDQTSTHLQNASGVGVVLYVAAVRLLMAGNRGLKRRVFALARDVSALIAVALWNAALNEWVRLGVQRARPYVFNPDSSAIPDPHNYTSFYSGHTSFAALAGTFAVIYTQRVVCPKIEPKQRPWAVATVTIAGLGVTLSTGAFRVLAGMHFLTDVLFGAFAGATLCIAVLSFLTTRLRFFDQEFGR